MKKKSKKIVVLLSGGLDSSTLAYLATKPSLCSNNRVFSLTFNYGQRHSKELNSAKKIAREIGLIEHKIIKIDLKSWGGSSLTDKRLALPVNRNFKLTHKSIPNTYVPARNTVFLAFALAYAEAINADEIHLGVNCLDYSGYVDCRPVYIKKFQELIKLATVKGIQGKAVKIKTPLINKTKSEIIKLGQKYGVDWGKTWSCYKGEKLACGVCDSCQLRLKGFMEAGSKDPLKYKQFPKFYSG